MEMGGHRHALAALSPRMNRYPLYRRPGVSQARSGWLRKISLPPGCNSARSESLYRLSCLGPWKGKDGETKRTARRITYPSATSSIQIPRGPAWFAPHRKHRLSVNRIARNTQHVTLLLLLLLADVLTTLI